MFELALFAPRPGAPCVSRVRVMLPVGPAVATLQLDFAWTQLTFVFGFDGKNSG